MSEFYLAGVVILFALAVIDLVVGVSNDAVNFLNSAIGSKVASRRVIMIVASLGIFIGATFSSGMMEIARKGIFNPEFFYFSDVMIIFLAVMLTDIILLDLFNTFGMPTSTTVSIVFELLGAAVIVALLKVTGDGQSLDMLGNYINSEKALAIISGIFLSVVVAFSVGAFVQYLSRLLFSFQFDKRMRWVGGLWTGLALTTLSYFLVFKGAKGASFISSNTLTWINDHIMTLLVGSFIFWTIFMQVLLILKVNVLRIVVLFGTFSLAMAFAGNDLVNFIGVPIAGFESYLDWVDSGIPAGSYLMENLREPVRTDTYLLLIAGLIMVLTLWFSRKARSVTETEVNLGRQDEGAERFKPNGFSRLIVRGTRAVGTGITSVVPGSVMNAIESNFKQVADIRPETDRPAFDLVRASVNLTTASMLIALATSLKLPLSTTYVSFMVAMGTSLSDRAWDRESAVYRVAGVLNVIGGWLLTAVVAFSVAGIFATCIHVFGAYGLVVLVIIAMTSILRSFLFHRKKERTQTSRELEAHLRYIREHDIQEGSRLIMLETLSSVGSAYDRILKGFFAEDAKALKQAQRELERVHVESQLLRSNLYRVFQPRKEIDREESHRFIQLATVLQDIVQSCELLSQLARTHVINSHKPLLSEQNEMLRSLRERVKQYFDQVTVELKDGKGSSGDIAAYKETQAEIEAGLDQQLLLIREYELSQKNNNLVFSFLIETRDLITSSQQLLTTLYKP